MTRIIGLTGGIGSGKSTVASYIASKGIPVYIADEEAKKLATTLYQAFLNIIRNDRRPYSPPVDDINEIWNPMEKAHVMRMLHYSFIGSQETVKNQLQNFQNAFQVDELMITSHIYEQEARLKSYEIIKTAVDGMI